MLTPPQVQVGAGHRTDPDTVPKRSDILLENGVERVKITDFGLARAVEDASATQSGTVAGTPMYVSPEQAEGLPIDQLIGQGENVRLQAKMVSPGRAHVTFRSTKSPAWVAAEALLDHDAPGRLAGALLL